MRVLLATPPWRFSEIYPASMSRTGGLSGDRWGTITGVTEPLGMLYLAARLRQSGHTPFILDGYGLDDERWLSCVLDHRPDLIGLSLSAFSFFKVLPYVARVKAALPAVPIVIGGPYPTAMGERALEQMPAADFAVCGAGEKALPQLCEALKRGFDFTDIAGLCHRRGEKLFAAPAETLTDLDALPFPARDLVDMTRYRPSIGFYNRLPSVSIMASRGCPQRCKFCVSENTLALRSPANVLDEISEAQSRYGIRHVLFWDEDLAIRTTFLEALCAGLRARRMDFSWCASMNITRVRPALLAQMKMAGCWKILFGLETGVKKNLETLGKFIPLDEAPALLAMVRAAGIETYATFMLGIPGETRAEAVRTIKYAAGLPLDYAVFLNFTPFPGTAFFKDLSDHGEFQGIWSTQAVSFVPHSMTLRELKELRVMAYRRFYFRPRYLLGRLARIKSRHDLHRYFRGFVAALRLRAKGVI